MRRMTIVLLLLMVLAAPLAAYDTGRSPMKAGALSLVLPGGGQVYNGKWIKAACVAGVECWFIGSAIYHDAKMNDAYDNAMSSSGDEYTYWAGEYDDHRDARQNAYWWLGTTVFLSVLDAYVDAHLYNFEEEKRRLHMEFDQDSITLSWDF